MSINLIEGPAHRQYRKEWWLRNRAMRQFWNPTEYSHRRHDAINVEIQRIKKGYTK